MKVLSFSVAFLLLCVISREVRCPSTSFAGINISIPSIWGKPEDTTDAAGPTPTAPTTVGGATSEMAQKLQTSLISVLPNVPESTRVQFLVALRAVITSIVPGASLITPIIDGVIAKYATGTDKDTVGLNIDTTDALIFKLMAQKIDDKNLEEFLQIGADSRLVKEVTTDFMNSLQTIIDNFVAIYVRNIATKLSESGDCKSSGT